MVDQAVWDGAVIPWTKFFDTVTLLCVIAFVSWFVHRAFGVSFENATGHALNIVWYGSWGAWFMKWMSGERKPLPPRRDPCV